MCGFLMMGGYWTCSGVVCSSQSGLGGYVLELLGVCGEAGRGLRGLDRLSWDETPWKSDRVRRLSPSCRLFGR